MDKDERGEQQRRGQYRPGGRQCHGTPALPTAVVGQIADAGAGQPRIDLGRPVGEQPVQLVLDVGHRGTLPCSGVPVATRSWARPRLTCARTVAARQPSSSPISASGIPS